MIYETIYKRLIRIIPEVLDPDFEYKKLEAENFMPLSIDVLHRGEDRIKIAMAHYYRHPSGDLIPDPDMEVAVFPEKQIANALTYQDSFGFRRVYPEWDKVDVQAERDLNRFLSQWLLNIHQQGHR